MNKDILYSFRVAEKLKEADAQQQQAPAQQQQPTSGDGNVDQSQLEKAFEAALQTIKTEIISGVQEMMEKFGEQLVSKISGGDNNNNNNENASSSGNNNNASNESNNNNNKEENTDGNQ